MLKVYPVIHYYDDSTTIEQALIAKEAGADGVFLISHIGLDERLIPLAVRIKEELKLKAGLNLLPFDSLHVANIVKANNLDMAWFDNCGVSSEGITHHGLDIKKFAEDNSSIEIFASIAFKYQKEEKNPVLAAKIAYESKFIPTTSGSGTGFAPEVDKIKSMFEATGLLAVASGMNNDNIDSFKNYLSYVLVSTGISKDDFHFDELKIKEFIKKAKS
jgi:predicted TIM-barrel enzyme